MTLTARDRLKACLADDPALDHPPVALWRHFPIDDQSPETLVAATLNFQRTYDFDLVKVTPASSFCLKDWGVEDEWRGNPEGTRDYTKAVIGRPQDWEKLPILPPSAAHLAEQISCLRTLRHELGPEVPILQTIFNPLAQAKNLAGGDILLSHMHQSPDALLKGLHSITVTTQRFVEACLETGIDGIFYAVQHAQASLLSFEEYETFGLPFDRSILDFARDLWCNLLHLHGKTVHFSLHQRLNLPILNWHDRETPPTLAEAQRNFPWIICCGGLSQNTIAFGRSIEVQEEAQEAIAQTGGRRLILGTGCVVPIISPYGNISTLVQAAKQATVFQKHTSTTRK